MTKLEELCADVKVSHRDAVLNGSERDRTDLQRQIAQTNVEPDYMLATERLEAAKTLSSKSWEWDEWTAEVNWYLGEPVGSYTLILTNIQDENISRFYLITLDGGLSFRGSSALNSPPSLIDADEALREGLRLHSQ